jgi:hypothetical protein
VTFRHDRRLTVQRRSGRRLGVKGVGLAAPPARLAVRRHQPSNGDFNDASRKLDDNPYLDRPILQDEANARRAGVCEIGESEMSFSVKGDYFETCNCDVSCACIWLGAATNDACDSLLAWHVTEGQKEGVDLAGLNVVMAVHAPKRMTDGNWKVALYLDDRATLEQSEALGAIFSGGAGGHLAGLGLLFGEVAGVTPASISFSRNGGSLKASVGAVLSMESEEMVGMDGLHPPVITNSTSSAVPQPLTQAKAGANSYHDHWDAEFSGTNSFVTDFAYQG